MGTSRSRLWNRIARSGRGLRRPITNELRLRRAERRSGEHRRQRGEGLEAVSGRIEVSGLVDREDAPASQRWNVILHPPGTLGAAW